jgi:acyl-coenzyme A synthetase/AMP-(fatty) acid ligase
VRALARELGVHKTLDDIVVVDKLLVNRNGKTDKGRLRALAAAHPPHLYARACSS